MVILDRRPHIESLVFILEPLIVVMTFLDNSNLSLFQTRCMVVLTPPVTPCGSSMGLVYSGSKCMLVVLDMQILEL